MGELHQGVTSVHHGFAAGGTPSLGACLGEGGSCGILLPSSNASRPAGTQMSLGFRGHRETESLPNRKCWFPHSLQDQGKKWWLGWALQGGRATLNGD